MRTCCIKEVESESFKSFVSRCAVTCNWPTLLLFWHVESESKCEIFVMVISFNFQNE